MEQMLPKEIRAKRELAYLYKEFDDLNLPRTVLHSVTDDEIVEHVIEFFVEGSTLVYPYKSYFVAVVYAACMMKYFHTYFADITDALSCEDLLNYDDEFFVPYNKKTNVYNRILRFFEDERQDILSFESTRKTENYFREEFLITEDEYKFS